MLPRKVVLTGASGAFGSALKTADDSLTAAITLYGGPIEVYGSPSSEALKQLASVFPRPSITGRPLDAAKNAPKLWQVHVPDGEDGRRGDVVVMFPGSSAWSLGDLDREEESPVKVWRSENAEFLDAAKQVPASDHLTVLGVTPELNRPTIMGASIRLDLLLSDLLSLSWDENGGVLKGQFAGSNRKATTAYVFVPAGWSFKSGSAGKNKISTSKGNSIIEIPVESGSATKFELAFLKK